MFCETDSKLVSNVNLQVFMCLQKYIFTNLHTLYTILDFLFFHLLLVGFTLASLHEEKEKEIR